MEVNRLKLSGSRFECIVGLNLTAISKGRILFNKEFYSNRINRETECDVIFITSHHIYCIECKNYSKSILGSYLDLNWYFKSYNKYYKPTLNAYLENSRHVRALSNLYRYVYNEEIKVENIICVPNTCQVYSDCTNIYTLRQLKTLILKGSCCNDIYNIDDIFNKILRISKGGEE